MITVTDSKYDAKIYLTTVFFKNVEYTFFKIYVRDNYEVPRIFIFFFFFFEKYLFFINILLFLFLTNFNIHQASFSM